VFSHEVATIRKLGGSVKELTRLVASQPRNPGRSGTAGP
jgi:hypothetical protein